jgi:ATP-dependent DNA helicase PIF1
MKLKCDLIIQNLNSGIRTNQQTKLHKSAFIGLYRPKIYESSDRESDEIDFDSANEPSDKSQIILTVETSDTNLKFKLKRIETYTKFIKEGKATLKLIDENIFLLISNSPALTLTNFISFLNVKLCKSNSVALKKSSSDGMMRPPTSMPPPPPMKYANKLLNRVQCDVGISSLTFVSPLTANDVQDVVKSRNVAVKKSTESPIRATGCKFYRSLSTNSLKSTEKSAVSSQSKKSSLQRSSSCSDLLIHLTDEQLNVLKMIKSGKSVFFTGSGGSGKSFLINIIKKSLPSDACFITASTGAAASLINGITIHAFAGFTLSADSTSSTKENSGDKFQTALNRVQNSREKVQNWKKCQHLIIDEISMIDAGYFDCLDFVARSVRNVDAPMGGIQVVLSGDFLQLPPVSKHYEEKKKFCFQVS